VCVALPKNLKDIYRLNFGICIKFLKIYTLSYPAPLPFSKLQKLQNLQELQELQEDASLTFKNEDELLKKLNC